MILINNQIIKLAGIAITCVVISACDTDFQNPVGSQKSTSGTADFSNFVAIGDSITAGYADAAIYILGQENSYPSVLAAQFAKAGGGSFAQPLMNDNLGGLLFGGTADPSFANRLVLDADVEEGENPSPEPIAGDPTNEVIGSGLNGSIFNNMAVPGAKSFHLLSTDYGNPAALGVGANPYFVRFATAPDTSMILDAAGQQPSFYVMYIGKNDVLSYATSGGTGTDQTGINFDPATYGPDDITDPIAVFPGVFGQLVDAFRQANPDVKGVLVNIPDVSTIPFFTTVPHNPLPLDQDTADALNAAYARYNGGVAAALGGGAITVEEAALRTITFAAGKNAVVIMDKDLTDLTFIDAGLIKMRQATTEDLLLLTTSSKIGELVNPADDPFDPASPRWGISAPLNNKDVLIPSEIQTIDRARLAFNATIEAEANADDNLLFFDVAAVMEALSTTGIDYGTGFVDATYATGGAFSLDGVHPTARGYAVIANGLIDTINEGFEATVPNVDPGARTTIFFK